MHTFAALTIPRDKVGIHWFGQSSFALKDNTGTLVQIDPYFPRERPSDRFIHPVSPLDESSLKTQFVLLTHDHSDHTCVESLQRLHEAFPETVFFGPSESVARLADSGIPQNLLKQVASGDEIPMGSMKATAVWAKPAAGHAEAGIDPPDVHHLGYVVEAGNVRVYVSGDPINTFAERDDLLRPIASLCPQIGLLTTHPTEGEFPFFAGSVETALKLGLEAAIPAHSDCFVARNYDAEAWAAIFPEAGPKPIIVPYNSAIVYPD